MSVFFDMFVPSRRHVEDERNRLEWTRDEEGEGDPHRGPIDLDSGVVSIQASTVSTASAPSAAPTTSTTSTASTAGPEHEPPVTTPAAPGRPRSEP